MAAVPDGGGWRAPVGRVLGDLGCALGTGAFWVDALALIATSPAGDIRPPPRIVKAGSDPEFGTGPATAA